MIISYRLGSRSGNIETLIRNAPTSANPDGAPVDNLTYTYTPRTNRLASVADAVSTDLDWDARPTSFVYNRVGSVTWTTEELTPTTYWETEIQIYDERQLPEELRIRLIATPGGAYDSTMVSYRYDVNGQRIRKQIRETAQGPDVVYERYVRDGMRLIGVFDESNNLKNWNIGGAAGLVGRAEPATLGFTRNYYVTDHLGSIRAVVNQSGTVIEGRDYYPYGLTMPGRFYVQADTTREGFTGYELDKETGLYYAGARFYGSALARWFVVDPLADAYPAWSPYGYVLGDPVSLVDPDGREVRCRTEEECQRAANELNAVHENHDGDTNITVEATTWEETRGILWWKKTVTVEGFRLSTGNSEFDWSQDQYTFALYDVINSEEVVFNLEMVSPETPMPGMPANYLAGRVLGHNYAGPGGGRVIVATSNRLNEPVGVVLMHELVGHGHPVGGSGGRQAWDINRHYQRKIGYTLRDSRGISINHRGYLSEIGWTRIGLYNK